MIDVLRSLVTVAAFSGFLAIVWWAYAPSRKELWQDRGRLDEEDR